MLGVLAKRLTLAAAAAVWMPAAALAQFAGDAFFLTPSVAVQEGQTGELDLAFFTAADPFGVAQMTVTWDPAQMEVEDVTLPPNAAAVLQQEILLEPGSLKVIVVNTSSVTEPIGTVDIAKITVRPLTAVGSRIVVQAVQEGAFNTDVNTYPRSGSAAAEVVVTAAPGPLRLAGAEVATVENPSPELLARAAAIAPAGGLVELVVVGADGAPERVRVRAPATAGAGESD
ncbi:hypothetical protein [Ruixingdingia sedimenti]|uniref:Cohesin domain-containing protein n=1 Tax=Ruixingdingia sedimenti TaxID=3073604 RepID=A0ABU1F504_9RHOB|nr:hypothetical protein [Xinfangfangia sp. LG-4]MDR5651955.1 hypothetical protein [Xinfangfangia sp. LG-4]